MIGNRESLPISNDSVINELISKNKKNCSGPKLRRRWGAVLSAPLSLAELLHSPEMLGVYCGVGYSSGRIRGDKTNRSWTLSPGEL